MSATVSGPPSSDPGNATLSTQSFPRRVRTLLEGIFEIVTGELDRGFIATLDGLEHQLFKLAEQARSNEVKLQCLEALGTVKRGRSDLMPRYIAALESTLAGVRGVEDTKTQPVEGLSYTELSLVAEVDMDESTLLHEIAARAEIRASLPLFLISQRFGVIAGKPAMDSETLPIGPATLCRLLRRASHCFELNSEHRQLLFRQFDRHLMGEYARLVEVVNAYLINQGVLPNLNYLPTRFRTEPRNPASAPTSGAASPPERKSPPSHTTKTDQHRMAASPAHVAAALSSAFTGWPGESIGATQPVSRSDEIFTDLRELLRTSRGGVGMPATMQQAHGAMAQPGAASGVASSSDVQSVLSLLQRRPTAQIMVDGHAEPQLISHIKQDLLAQLRQITGNDPPPALANEDTDTIDLVGLLFDEIIKDVRPNSPAANLLGKLQVPLLRVALRDKHFFSQQAHPARQMVDAVAETGTYWAGDDPADRELIDNVQRLVDRISQDFDGDIGLFNTLLTDLSNYTQSVIRRAEVAERRHVEAARGKERLTLAQAHASQIMDDMTKAHPLPKFTRSLLNQAWTDVLALTALRHGENSDEWLRQIDVAGQIVAATSTARDRASVADPEQTAALGQHVEQSLMQVGYHADEAAAIGQRLSTGTEDADDPTSRTEIAMKLKARARLGEYAGTKVGGIQLPPLTEREQECMERIRELPFGSWLEFVTNQQGDTVRRRLSWFSLASGHCLFINHRGQRVGDYTLDTLARAMARNQVMLVEKKKESFLGRAMHRVIDALRGPAAPPEVRP